MRKATKPWVWRGDKNIDVWKNEVRAMKILCKHPHENIVAILNHGRVDPKTTVYFIDMEYCDANLEDFVTGKCSKIGLLNWPTATNRERIRYLIPGIMDPVLSGLEFIHNMDEIHRDISSQNSNSFVHTSINYSLVFKEMQSMENCRLRSHIDSNHQNKLRTRDTRL